MNSGHSSKHSSDAARVGSFRSQSGRIILAGFATLAALGVIAWSHPEPLLRAAIDLWSVSDAVGPADAVAVFGGGYKTRPIAAADYYRKGLVKKILIAGVRPEEVHSEIKYNHDELIDQGVPETAIEVFGRDLTSTIEEVTALRDWAVRNRIRRLIVPTEYFASRRVHWAVSRMFTGTGIQVMIPALDYPKIDGYPKINRNEWWKNDQAVETFKTEILKYIYYRLRY